eukprot:TRINITY_DN4008_c0_g1_i1.p1 TRINITY_DN4008_c0_g1~~TRINITY_DN4008_c0_g1_i1.p1  ORF type:complete len:287 (+),score=76.32 TRINITY_DN4008_c0_g1_i1:62-922(+)
MDYFSELSAADIKAFVLENKFLSFCVTFVVAIGFFLWSRVRKMERNALLELLNLLNSIASQADDVEGSSPSKSKGVTDTILLIYDAVLRLELQRRHNKRDTKQIEKLAAKHFKRNINIRETIIKLLCKLYPSEGATITKQIAEGTSSKVGDLTSGESSSLIKRSSERKKKAKKIVTEEKAVEQQQEEKDEGDAEEIDIDPRQYGMLLPVIRLIIIHSENAVVFQVILFRFCSMFSDDDLLISYIFSLLEKRYKDLGEEEMIEFMTNLVNFPLPRGDRITLGECAGR